MDEKREFARETEQKWIKYTKFKNKNLTKINSRLVLGSLGTNPAHIRNDLQGNSRNGNEATESKSILHFDDWLGMVQANELNFFRYYFHLQFSVFYLTVFELNFRIKKKTHNKECETIFCRWKLSEQNSRNQKEETKLMNLIIFIWTKGWLCFDWINHNI